MVESTQGERLHSREDQWRVEWGKTGDGLGKARQGGIQRGEL